MLGPTNYLYDGRNLLEELDASGNVLARYTHGKGIDSPLAQSRSLASSYYQQDGLGSVTSLSTSAGALANTYRYDGFGKLTASTGTLTNPFQYTGREFDPETGIYEYRARYYDPNVGRFISADPKGKVLNHSSTGRGCTAMLGLVALRAAIGQMQQDYAFSQRRACRLMMMAVTTYRCRSQRSDEPLRTKLVVLAREKPRFGYRRLHVLSRRSGERVNRYSYDEVAGRVRE